MKFTARIISCFALFVLFINLGYSQEASLTEKYKEDVVVQLCQLMNDFYVFPEVAKETETHLKKQLEEGYYNQFTNDETFAAALTESVQSVNHDKHMRVRVNRPYEAPDNTPERKIEEKLDFQNRSRSWNAGFNRVEILEGNVGYLDLRNFAGLNEGKEIADAYMKLLAQTDAIIIDLSKNGGGDPAMVQYLCSYFFNQKLHLNSLYFREGDVTEEFWTLDKVGGTKLPDVPLFVLTSNRTFSGAEEFSYNMQTQRRAILVGQTTGGGANPGGTRGINENLSVFIPSGKAINPITLTNWEGVGVVPEIITEEHETFEKAHEIAKKSAESYRLKNAEAYTKVYMSLLNNFEEYVEGKSDADILKALTDCQKTGTLSESDVNMLGYEYLMEHDKPKIAECIFKANTQINPNSANVFDSYGEALMMNGNLKSSIENYQKAVELAEKNEDPDLDFYKENLAKVKIMADKK